MWRSQISSDCGNNLGPFHKGFLYFLVHNQIRVSLAVTDIGNIQCYVARDSIGEESYADFKKYDVGDIVGIDILFFVRIVCLLLTSLLFRHFSTPYQSVPAAGNRRPLNNAAGLCRF